MAEEKQTSGANTVKVYARIPDYLDRNLQLAVARRRTSKPKAIVEGVELWLSGATMPNAVSTTVSKAAYRLLKELDAEPSKAVDAAVEFYSMDRLRGLDNEESDFLEGHVPCEKNTVNVYACLPEDLAILFEVAVARSRKSKPKAIIEAVLLWLHNRNEVPVTVSRRTYDELNRQARIFEEKGGRMAIMLPEFLNEVVAFYREEHDPEYLDKHLDRISMEQMLTGGLRPGVFPVSLRPVYEEPEDSEPEEPESPEATPLSAITLKTLKDVVKAAVGEAIAELRSEIFSAPPAATPVPSSGASQMD